MNNLPSAVLCVGALLFFFGTFSLAGKLTDKRDKWRREGMWEQRDSELELHATASHHLEVLDEVIDDQTLTVREDNDGTLLL